MLNEAHFTYSRESRPRTAVDSPLHADTGIGFNPTFRFGNPFFLQPNVDELIWRTQIKDNISLVMGKHTFKFGGEWMHTLNDQIFRGFFTGRYLFGSVAGLPALCVAGGAWRVSARTPSSARTASSSRRRPRARAAARRPAVLSSSTCRVRARAVPATDAAGASTISNDEFSLFVQDQWQPTTRLTLNYGLRWDAQRMPETVDPRTTAYGAFLNDPAFPSDGTIPSQWAMFQPRFGVAWDVTGNGKSRRPRQRRHLFGAAEHALAGRIDHDQRHPAADAVRADGVHGVRCDHADVAGRADTAGGSPWTVSADFSGRARLPS